MEPIAYFIKPSVLTAVYRFDLSKYQYVFTTLTFGLYKFDLIESKYYKSS